MMWREVAGATTQTRTRPAAVTIGTFDGVHRGHQHVLARTRELADGAPVVAVTFDPHPMAVVRPEHEPRKLTTLERRVELLHEHGADEVRVLAFSTEMSGWSPEEFVERVLADQLHSGVVVVGEKFRFGHKAAGDVAFLARAGEGHGFTAVGLPLVGDGEILSSTRVRAHVAAGELREAAEVLGRPHEVSGVVTRGEQRGRELGFPTANVPVDESYAVPPDGVYAGWVVAGQRLPAAISIGTNPTFDGVERRVESYVLDRTDLNLYDQVIRVELVEHLRGMVKFEGIDALIETMNGDVEKTRVILEL
ncbi:bifunctional riboflavin kinase/FAD synthetase [Aeromicrobium panaciterrae]|uniref:bifunctional riboflavin kinase/FAD synthetase n=1 Tax=Aeromicrobium panaciterrae TaxID=363861 RepID=UPI0031D5AFE1